MAGHGQVWPLRDGNDLQGNDTGHMVCICLPGGQSVLPDELRPPAGTPESPAHLHGREPMEVSREVAMLATFVSWLQFLWCLCK